jgi:hypothetical protein
VWDRAVIQTCVIHLLHNTFRYASRKYWDQIAKDIRPVCTAPTETAAKERFVEFTAKWGAQNRALKAFTITFNGRITPTGKLTKAKVESTVNQTVPSHQNCGERF